MQQDSVDLDVPEEKIPKRASTELLEGERLEDLEACVVGQDSPAVHCAKQNNPPSAVNNSGEAEKMFSLAAWRHILLLDGAGEGSVNVSMARLLAFKNACSRF